MLPSLVSLRSGGFGVASVGAIKHLSEGRSQYVLTAEELQLIIDKFPKPLHAVSYTHLTLPTILLV